MVQWRQPDFEQLGPAVYWHDESRPIFNSIQFFSSSVSQEKKSRIVALTGLAL